MFQEFTGILIRVHKFNSVLQNKPAKRPENPAKNPERTAKKLRKLPEPCVCEVLYRK